MSRPSGQAEGFLSAYAAQVLAERAAARAKAEPARMALPPPAQEDDPQATFFTVRPGVWEDHLAANRDLTERLHQAMSKAGLGRRDPLTPAFNLLTEMLQRHTQLAADQVGAMRQVAAEGATELRCVLEAAIRTMEEAATAALQAAAAASSVVKEEANGGVMAVRYATSEALAEQDRRTRRVEGTLHGMVQDTLEETARRQRHLRWQDLAKTSAIGVLLLLTGGAFMFWWGAAWKESSMQATLEATRIDVQQTEASLQAAFATGPQDAAGWVELMKWNPGLPGRMPDCIKTRAFIGDARTQRMACEITVWVEPPPSPEVVAARMLAQAQKALQDAGSSPPARGSERRSERSWPPSPGPMHFGD